MKRLGKAALNYQNKHDKIRDNQVDRCGYLNGRIRGRLL